MKGERGGRETGRRRRLRYQIHAHTSGSLVPGLATEPGVLSRELIKDQGSHDDRARHRGGGDEDSKINGKR